MRFRRGKEDGGGSAAPDAAPAPPDAATRVEDPIAAPPPSPGERTDPPPSAAERTDTLDATPTSGYSVQEPKPEERADFPAPAPADQVLLAPGSAPPPTPSDRTDAPPPNAAARVESPAPVAAAAAPPPQPDQLVSAAPPAAATGTACPQCGTPAQPGQEMCIACGSRIAPAAARERGWLVPALLAGLGVLLVGTAVAFAIVELTDDDEVKKSDVADLSSDPAPPPPATTQPTPPASTTPTEPTPTPTIPPASGETQPDDPNAQPDQPADTPGSGGEIAEWPAGKTAYTVVLVSATSRNAADAKAEQAIKRGIKAGVLRSDDFSTLRAGYWVVFAGQFDTSEQATRAADRYAEQGFGGGYPRQVKPK